MNSVVDTRVVKLNSVSKVDITNFSIKPEILGSSMEFEFRGHNVLIRLPTVCDGKRVVISGHFTDSKDPSRMEVYSLDIEVVIAGRITIPCEMLKVSCNAYALVDDELKQKLEDDIFKYQNISNEVIDLWLRCLRWKLGDWRVGRDNSTVGSYVNVANVYLVDNENKHNIWGGPLHYTTSGCYAISKDCWNEVESSLKNKFFSPVYYDLLFDSEAHFGHGELQRSLVEAAMAAEIFIRTIIQNHLPPNINRKISKFVDSASIRKVFESFLFEHLNENQVEMFTRNNSAFKEEILNLFSDRNTIMHSGEISDLTREKCSFHIENVKKLFAKLGGIVGC